MGILHGLLLVNHGVLSDRLHGSIGALALLPFLDFPVLLDKLATWAAEGGKDVSEAVALDVELLAYFPTADELEYAGAYTASAS